MEKSKCHKVGNRHAIVLKENGEWLQYVILNSAWKGKVWMLIEKIEFELYDFQLISIEDIISTYQPDEDTVNELREL